MPYNLVFEALGPLVECSGYLAMLLAAVMGLLNVRYFLLFTLLAFAYGIFLSVSAVFLDELRLKRYPRPRDVSNLLLFTVLENLGYRQMQAFWRVKATMDYLAKRSHWGEMKRKGYESE
jgi:hypothetical protein